MRSFRIQQLVLFAWGTTFLFLLNGCGGGSGANVVTVAVTSSAGTTIILGSSSTLTATVTGATNLGVTWETPQYTTTTISNGKSTTSTATNIPSDGSMGTLTNQTTTSPATATYTAPSKLPDQTKFPGLQIIFTAQSQQNTNKTGKLTIVLDSGIGENLTPTTASVPTNEPQAFTAVLTNDTQNLGVTWLITQASPNSTNPPTPVPQLATCSPGCGSIQSTGLYTATYTAPSSIPSACNPAPASGTTCTAADVTIIATSKADNTRFLTGTITIVQGGPITFNGVSPSIAPQGATLWDVYLDAPNISSASKITITDQNGGSKTFSSSDATNQIKVLFPIPTSTTANPTSTGARLRLREADLLGSAPAATPITCGNVSNAVTCYTLTVTDPGEPVTPTAGGNFTLALVPVRPTVVSSSPDSVVQGQLLLNNFNMAIHGGYFGPGAGLVDVSFQGNGVPQSSPSNSRQYNAAVPTTSVNGVPPGLYPLSLTRSSAPPASVTTLGVFPDYSATNPQVVSANATSMANPTAVDIDPILGVIAVAEAGSGTAPGVVEFFSIGAGTLTSLGTAPVGILPTGISVNRTNHTAAVVNYGSQNVSVVAIPGSNASVPSTPIDLSSVLQGVASPAPLPYSIGVDPDTNLALVAFSCTNTSCIINGNLGFVVNLNQSGPFGCLQSGATPPCVFSQVTLDTGGAPQIAMAPHGHIAYVTPGAASTGSSSGSTISGIDVTHTSTSVGINNVALNAGSVTVTTTANLTGLVPGIPATVLVSGVPAPPSGSGCPSGTNFNGIFSIFVTGNTTFTYVLNPNGTGTCTVNGTAGTSNVFYGTPNLSFTGVSSGAQGIAINPITHTAAIANPNATTALQISLLNQLDLSLTSISFSSGCTFYNTQASPPCPAGGADLGNANVAWQPYTNSVVSYNSKMNQLSVSDPVSQTRRALINIPGSGQATLSVNNGTTGSLTLWGGVSVDPATNQAFVVESGSGSIQVVNLAGAAVNGQTIKPVNVTEIVVPSPSGAAGTIGGLPGGSLPQGTLSSTTDLAGVQIFGSGFASGAQVLLDGTPIPAANVTIDPSGRKITATIPASPFLSMPHRFALTVSSGGATSNPTDFIVIKAVDMSAICSGASGPINTQPSSVAIADQLANGPFSPIAVVTNSGCNSISVIDINPASPTFGTLVNPVNNALPATFPVGSTPQGIAVSQHLGIAVVANNGDGTASIVNLVNALNGTSPIQPVPAVTTGTTPVGVAINDATGAALVANFGANTVSEINLGLLFPTPPASITATSIGGVQQPIAIAIDPDGGTNNRGLAVTTGIQASIGALYPVDIGAATPILSTTVSTGSVNSTPTGIVFDPTVFTGSANPGLFYINSSGADTIMSYNDNTGGTSIANVGINPTALAINPQTGAILTSNFGGQSASIVDTLANPFTTRQTLGIPGSPQFGVAIDPFTNLAVIVDQGNNRVLLFAMPN
jgi:DNA-binding beta-propeller fold protein YncE